MYPYLLRDRVIDRPELVWASDIERHEALLHRVVVKGHRLQSSQRADAAEGSLTPGDAGEGGKQP